MVNPFFPLPPSVHPEPLIGILANHRLKNMVHELRVRLDILFDISSICQLKWLLDQQTMLSVPIPNHENRENRSSRPHRQNR